MIDGLYCLTFHREHHWDWARVTETWVLYTYEADTLAEWQRRCLHCNIKHTSSTWGLVYGEMPNYARPEQTFTYVVIQLSLTGLYSILECHSIWFHSVFVCFLSVLNGSGIITPNEEEISGRSMREVRWRGIQCDHLEDIYEMKQLSYTSATYRRHNSSCPPPLVRHLTSQKYTNYLSESASVKGWKAIQLVYTRAHSCNSVSKSSEGICLRFYCDLNFFFI